MLLRMIDPDITYIMYDFRSTHMMQYYAEEMEKVGYKVNRGFLRLHIFLNENTSNRAIENINRIYKEFWS